MPTSEDKTVMLNGKAVAPIKKTKLPPGVDWQALARKLWKKG